MKISWNEIWMDLAYKISTRSNDPRTKVGSVIVTEDNESVLSIGFNGDEKGGNNIPDSLEPGKSNFIHSEVNAVAKLNYTDPRKRKIYLTHSPCVVCSRLLINSKIETVYYSEEYRDLSGLELLRKHNVKCEQIKQVWD